MSEEFRVVMEKLSRVPGVQGALIVDTEAGVPVVDELAEGVSGRAVAALAASLYRRTARGAEIAEFGTLDTLQLQAEGGHVVVAGLGDLVVVAVAESNAQLGLVRLQAHRAAEELR